MAGSLLEIVFSFDTTGSMYGYLDQVRGRLQDMITRLQADIPTIRLAVFAHGDYCDAATYITKWQDFSTDVVKLCDFVSTVSRTGVGDAPECYELVLRQARTELSWTPGSRRVLVMIGDDVPHQPDEACNKDNIDWLDETRQLAVNDVTVYGVQCGSRPNATIFYQTLATATGGKHLQLEAMGGIFDVLMAVCYREGSDTSTFAVYENEARSRGGAVGPDVDAIFRSLRKEDESRSKATVVNTPPKVLKAVSRPPKLPSKKSTPIFKKKPEVKGVAKKLCFDKIKKTKVPHHIIKLREKVSETAFNLRCSSWSRWQVAISPDIPVSTRSQPAEHAWVSRRGRPGHKLKFLPHSKSSPLMYEVGVVEPGRRCVVTYSRVSRCCMDTSRWEQKLLSQGTRAEVDKAVNKGCHLVVRHCPLASIKSLKKRNGSYDYAWNQRGGIRECM